MAIDKCCTGKQTDSVCIQADKIYDSCKSKECAQDLRVYFSEAGQAIIDNANNIRLKCAEVLYVDTDVEKIQFSNCNYNVSSTFYFKVTVEIAGNGCNNTCIEGLDTYTKNTILFGSEACSYVFTSNGSNNLSECPGRANLPTAVVETVNPVPLDAKLTDICHHCHNSVCSCCCSCCCATPSCICSQFPEGLVETSRKRVYVTLGLFIIVRLQRETQLLIPSYDFCIPDKNCSSGSVCKADPCSFFESLEFPLNAFYPANCCNEDTSVSVCSNSCNNSCTTTIPLASPFKQKD